MKLLYELTADGSISVPTLSKKLGINASVLYSRIKRLMKKKLIKKFTIEIDDSLLGIGVKASVGINRDPKFKDEIHKQFMQTAEIVSISEITGRFDIMINVYAKNLEDLHAIVIEKIGKIDGIQNTETFVELQKTDKDPTYLIQ
jgi:Lrp/AsnC family transcriptional regulator for asnA, asnC and gidA